MLDIKMANIIQQLTDQFLDRSVTTTMTDYLYDTGNMKRVGLMFHITASVAKYSNDKDTVETSRNIFFLLCGNTNVWIAEQDPHKEERRWGGINSIPLDAWKNTSNHDSCWRSDGVESPLSQIYFDMCDEVNRQLPEEDRVAPKDLSMFNTFGFGDIVKHVTIVHAAVEPTDTYRRKIVEVEKTEPKI